MKYSSFHNYDPYPSIRVAGDACAAEGWEALRTEIRKHISGGRCVAVCEMYPGTDADAALLDGLLEVAQLVRKYRGITPDELCMHTGRPYAEVAALIALLEQEDFITADLLQRCSINPKKL